MDAVICYDPIVIIEPKTFHNHEISIPFGLMDYCHSRRLRGVPLSPTSEIFLPTDVGARYEDQTWHFSGIGDNCRTWQAVRNRTWFFY
jgi:hypothetical protein